MTGQLELIGATPAPAPIAEADSMDDDRARRWVTHTPPARSPWPDPPAVSRAAMEEWRASRFNAAAIDRLSRALTGDSRETPAAASRAWYEARNRFFVQRAESRRRST